MPTIDSLLADAAQLPVEDRIHLIDALWDTLPADSLPPLSEELLTELKRRSAEFDSGLAKTVSWTQVKSEAIRRAGVSMPDARD